MALKNTKDGVRFSLSVKEVDALDNGESISFMIHGKKPVSFSLYLHSNYETDEHFYSLNKNGDLVAVAQTVATFRKRATKIINEVLGV